MYDGLNQRIQDLEKKQKPPDNASALRGILGDRLRERNNREAKVKKLKETIATGTQRLQATRRTTSVCGSGTETSGTTTGSGEWQLMCAGHDLRCLKTPASRQAVAVAGPQSLQSRKAAPVIAFPGRLSALWQFFHSRGVPAC